MSTALSPSDCFGPKKGASILVRVAKLLCLSIFFPDLSYTISQYFMTLALMAVRQEVYNFKISDVFIIDSQIIDSPIIDDPKIDRHYRYSDNHCFDNRV